MFTHVKSDDKEYYEIELEFYNYYFTNSSIDILKKIITKKFPFIRIDPYPKELIRPKNLLRENILEIMNNEYTVTNKLDGIRFHLFILPLCMIAHNKTELIYICNQQQKTDITCCLDAEYFHKKFYVWDCDFYINPLHVERINYIKTLILPSNYIEIKIFYTDIIEGTNLLLQNNKLDDNDGLIYTCPFGRIIKKWKYPSKYSIDFRIKYVTNKLIHLYAYDPIKCKEIQYSSIFHK